MRSIVVLYLILTFISCKKITDDFKEAEGTYEWAYSYSYSYYSHGSGYTTYQYPDESLRKAIKIEKRKVYMYENGKEVYTGYIKKLNKSEHSISIETGTKKHRRYFSVYDGTLHNYDPDVENEFSHIYYKN